MNMDLHKIEKKWQKKWKQAKAFEPKRGKGKKFFFTVPYPYTSGPLHVGHGRTYCVADFMVRFKRKQGYNVLWPMAFHISGTPILAISDRIKKGDKKYTKLFTNYVSIYEGNASRVKKIIKSFEKPEGVASYFASVISNDFDSIGLSIDWTRKFNTGDKDYNKFIEWQYKKLNEGKAITQGNHPVTYCVNCGNAVGEDDIKDGDTDKVKINEFTATKSTLGDKKLIASSLRPETIYGITNLWVNPSATYVEAEVKNELLVMSYEAFEKLEYQEKNLKKTREFLGKELIGKYVKTPIDSEVIILPGRFVDPDTASGIVYSVPAHAPLDYIGLKDLQENEKEMREYGLNVKEIKSLKPITLIDVKGYKKEPAIQACEELGVKNQLDEELIEKATKRVYKNEYYKGILNKKCKEFAGLKVNEIKDQVINKLKKQGKAFTFYETSRKAECRCSGKIVIAVLDDQWFLDYTSKEWKNKTAKLVKEMTIYPEKYRKSFLDVIDWVEKRPCARRRGLGTKFPYDKKWVIESLSDSTIYMAFYLAVKIIKKYKIKPAQLTSKVFDYVFLGKGDVKARWAKEMREEFTYWYPNDQRHTAPGHIGNHLLFFLLHHTKVFPKKYWPRAMTFNEFLTGREGVKMSKSKGNVIPLIDISRKYSADLYRMFVVSSTEIDTQADWREKEVMSTKNKLVNFANMALTSSNAIPAKKFSNIDNWIRSRFYSRLKQAYKQGSEMRLREYAITIFFEFINELNYYKNRVGAKQYNSIVRTFLKDWLIALEPIIPHVCEEVWSRISKGFVSLQQFPKIKESLINKSIEQSEKIVMNTVKDINEVLGIIKKKPKKISLFIPDTWKYKLYRIIVKSKDKQDFKALISAAMKDTTVKSHGKEAIKIIQSLVNNPSRIPESVTSHDKEYEALNQAIKFLEKEYNTEIDVVKNSTEQKARSAVPGKPGILIE